VKRYESPSVDPAETTRRVGWEVPKSQDMRRASLEQQSLHSRRSSNIPTCIVLPRSFITTYLLPFSKCIQHREEDEGGIRPGGFEPLLVFVVPFPPCSPVSGSLSVILADLLSREPLFPVDITPHL